MEGQTLREEMEGVMKYNGIEFGAFRAGDIQGNGCRELMSCGGEITKSMVSSYIVCRQDRKIAATRRLVSCAGCTPGCWAILRPSFQLFAKKVSFK